MEIDIEDKTFEMLETAANKGDGNKKWFIDIDDWSNLSNQDIDICDNELNVIFTIKNGTLEQANYICLLNNVFHGVR